MNIDEIYVQIEAKKLRTLLSLSEQSLRFSSGKGTFECKRTIKEVTDSLNKFVEMIEKSPLRLMLPIEIPNEYEYVGISQYDGQLTMHLRKKVK